MRPPPVRAFARGQRSLFNSFRRIGDGTLINIIYDVNSAARYRFRDWRNDIIVPRDGTPRVFIGAIEIRSEKRDEEGKGDREAEVSPGLALPLMLSKSLPL